LEETPNFKFITRIFKNPIFKKLIRSFLSLAFFPPEYIKQAFKDLKDQNVENFLKYKNLESFINYFNSNFVGLENKDNTVYDLKMWSVYDNVINNIPKSTNSLEGWHRGLNASIVQKHPNFANFVTILQREEEVCFVKLLQ
jgi:hypothetical protein